MRISPQKIANKHPSTLFWYHSTDLFFFSVFFSNICLYIHIVNKNEKLYTDFKHKFYSQDDKHIAVNHLSIRVCMNHLSLIKYVIIPF